MKVLIACEYSGIVREAFNKIGHDAWSCDLLDTEIPGKHIKGDVLKIINDGWDLMIAHPPCTYLTNAANRFFLNNPVRWEKRLEAMNFVHKLLNAPINYIALENPVGAISTWISKPNQIIQPWQFGDRTIKKTCLWLKNIPPLLPTEIVEPEYIVYNSKSNKKGYSIYPVLWKNSKNGKERSKFFPGVANAMAVQWGNL